MRQAAYYFATIAVIAANRAAIAPAVVLRMPSGLATCLRIACAVASFAPVETLVDWLEAAYGGPVDRDGV
jgi:hypothetical protein